jgi:hypothetical protein
VMLNLSVRISLALAGHYDSLRITRIPAEVHRVDLTRQDQRFPSPTRIRLGMERRYGTGPLLRTSRRSACSDCRPQHRRQGNGRPRCPQAALW